MGALDASADPGTELRTPPNKDDSHKQDKGEQSSSLDLVDHKSSGVSDNDKSKKSSYQTKFSGLDSEVLPDLNCETSDERGNFQSVIIITPNNSLRQKHQNIVSAPSEVSKSLESKIQHDKQALLHLLQNAPTSQALEK
jgi:hypothetical protein